MYDLDTWKTVEPPKGVVYSYPPRGDEQTSMFGAPARSAVGAQMYNQAINTVMVAKLTQGNEKLDDVIKWAETELEGARRAWPLWEAFVAHRLPRESARRHYA